MNERIKELFNTIRKHKHTYNLMSNPPQVRYNYTIEEEDIEKFAKLIVQECIDICDAYGMPDGTSQTAMILSAAIKRKFGVKQ